MRICVFCGSRQVSAECYRRAAVDLGQALAYRNFELVYGGSTTGLMGVLANAALGAGGRVVGVIPRFLVDREIAHRSLTEMRIVESLSERKSTMFELSDAFIALPGGFGTMDEFFEALTTAQIGLHAKPCILLNVGGFFNRLLDFLGYAAFEGFIDVKHQALVRESSTVSEALDIVETSCGLPESPSNPSLLFCRDKIKGSGQ